MIGVHFIGSVSPHLGLLSRWKPRACLLLDPGGGSAQAVKDVSPNTFLIGRVYRPDGEISDRIQANPQDAARWAASLIAPVAASNPQVDVWQFNNEVVQTSTALIQKLNDFSIHYVNELQARGLKAAIGCFSVGNPKTIEEEPSQWAAFYPAMRHAKGRGGVLLLHAYGAPTIFQPDDSWYLHRYEKRVVNHLPADLQDMPYCYGEYGCDMGVVGVGQRGWKTGYMGNWDHYAADLYRAAEFLAWEPNCKGATVFQLGNTSDWADFAIDGDCANKLAGIAWPSPIHQPPTPPPPPPPPPGGTMTLEDKAFELMIQQQLRITPTFALPSAIIRENQRRGDNYLGYDIVTNEIRFDFDGRRYAMMGAQRVTDEAKMVVVAPDGNWQAVQVFVRGEQLQPAYEIKSSTTPNWSPRPSGMKVSAVVLHHTGGSGSDLLKSTLNYFKSPAAEVSSHYVIGKKGEIYLVVPEEHNAWHAGYSISPDGRENVNTFSLGYEICNKGDGNDPYPKEQLEAVKWLLRLHRDRYGIGKEDVYTHKDVRARFMKKYPDFRDAKGNKVTAKTDPLGLNVSKLLTEVYG